MDNREKKEKNKTKVDLDKALETGQFHYIKEKVTPASLTSCTTNALLKALKVTKKLKELSKEVGPEQKEFETLATRVQEFSTELIDPMKSYDKTSPSLRGYLATTVDKAVCWKQKQFISHPVVDDLLQKKWYGSFYSMARSPWTTSAYWRFLLLKVLALLGVLLFPFQIFISLVITLLERLLGKKKEKVICVARALSSGVNKTTPGLIEDALIYVIERLRKEMRYRLLLHKEDDPYVISDCLEPVRNKLQNEIPKPDEGDKPTLKEYFEKCLKAFPPRCEKVFVLFLNERMAWEQWAEVTSLIEKTMNEKIKLIAVCIGKETRLEYLTESSEQNSNYLYFRTYESKRTLGEAIIKKIKRKTSYDHCMEFFKTPYFIYIRDTTSYLTLLGILFAICLSPPTVSFSALEWVILVFFVGRIFMEWDQLLLESCSCDEETFVPRKVRHYFSDRWNWFDFLMLNVYTITLFLRIITSTGSLLVTNNRLLAVTGYLYGFIALLLALRTFGHMLEAPRNMGTILIAFFRITQNLGSILCQFMAVIVAFSLPIAKIYITERFYVPPSNDRKPLACDDTDGLSCWWSVVAHLGWSVLGMPDVVLLESVDVPSVILAQTLYGVFLILGVILLVNMMIALLSNTYQQVEDNSMTEWSFKKAVTIQTYSVYHWVPVPFNILSLLARVLFRCLEKSNEKKDDKNDDEEGLNGLIDDLKDVYFATHGRSFPLKGDLKTERLLQECHGNRRMSNQIARHVFSGRRSSFHESQSGSDAWDTSGIEVEGCLLTCKGSDICDCHEFHNYRHGARYMRAFTAENPRMEVVIQEEGKSRKLAVGVVYENYGRHCMPGWYDGTVGYHADDGLIYQAENETRIKDAMAHRGDQMACEVDFSRKNNETHEVPVIFFLNGKKLYEASMKTVDENGNEKKLFPHIGMGTKESQVLVQICPSPRKVKTGNEKQMNKTLGTIQENSEDWESAGIEIEGCQMTCKGSWGNHGARYKIAFSADNPRMEVLVQNEGTGDLTIGVVYENYDHHWMPGEFKGTVAFHANNGIINQNGKAKKIEDAKAHQGDLMACEVHFIRENKTDHTVPVMFFLNDSYIGEADMKTVDEDGKKTKLFPCIGMGSVGIQVDVQMCPSLRTPRISEAQGNASPASAAVTANTSNSGIKGFYKTSYFV